MDKKISFVLTVPGDDNSLYTPRIVQAWKEYIKHVEENEGNNIVGTTFTASNRLTIETKTWENASARTS